MSLTIRTAAPADAPAILHFIQALADYEREPDAVEVTAGVLAEQLAWDHPPFECLIAAQGGEDVGFALFFSTYSTWRGRPGIWLEDLFVPPERRGLGVGKALLARVAALAVERGCARMEWSVLDWNEPAIGFYRALGATSMDEWTTNRLTGDALELVAASSRSTRI